MRQAHRHQQIYLALLLLSILVLPLPAPAQNDDAWFAAKSYPIYVIIDREGNVSDIARGAAHETGIRNMLRRAGLRVE